jgi:hypothetical protein
MNDYRAYYRRRRRPWWKRWREALTAALAFLFVSALVALFLLILLWMAEVS